MSVTWFDGVTFTFEVGWTSSPSTAIGSTTWTDESARVRNVSTRRGRSDVFDSFQAGSMSVTLSNADRRFDPNYAAGALFGNLLPMRRARIKITYSAVTYNLWSGFLNDLPQEYDIGNRDATVTLQCTDAFKVLNLLKLPDSVYAVQLPLDTPTSWWRLGEQSGSTAIDSSGGGRDGTIVGGATFNSAAGLIFGGVDTSIAFDGVDYVQVPVAITAFPITVEGWFSCTLGNTPIIYIQESFDAVTRIELSVQATGEVRTDNISGVAPAVSIYTTITTAVIADGNAHHVVAVFTDGSTAAIIYVDGVAQATTTNTLNLPVAFPGAGIACINGFVSSSGVVSPNTSGATIDEVALYGSIMSAGTALAHYNYGSNPWAGDTSGARVGRLLDLVAWPSADRTIATGVSTIQAQALANQGVLTALQTIESSEQGQLFMGTDGTVVFRDRHWRFENSLAITSNATFGDNIGVELGYSDIQTDGGERLIYNRVRASRERGATLDVSDATSVAKFYERTNEVTALQNESDLEVRDLANWRLATHKNPIQRVTVLEIRPRGTPVSLFPQVLARDIGHRITVKRRPQDVGTVLTYTVLIEGIEHMISADGDWITRWYLSAADSQSSVQPLVLDDATYGLLDTNVLAY